MDSSDSSPDRQEPRPAGGKGVTPAVLALLALGLILARLHTYAEPLERDITGYATAQGLRPAGIGGGGGVPRAGPPAGGTRADRRRGRRPVRAPARRHSGDAGA